MDYRSCASQIYEQIGGKDNLISAAHCATRLRLVIADNSKVNVPALEEIEGVKGVFDASGQLQLIIGTGTVNKVTGFGAFINIFPGVEALLPVSEMSDENVNPFNEFKVGDSVEVLIKKFTPQEHRIALSTKDISKNA